MTGYLKDLQHLSIPVAGGSSGGEGEGEGEAGTKPLVGMSVWCVSCLVPVLSSSMQEWCSYAAASKQSPSNFLSVARHLG